MSVPVDVDFAEDVADGGVGFFALEEPGNLFVADVSTVVDVEVFKGPLVVLPLQIALGIQGSDQELGVLNLARTVQVDQPHHHRQSLLLLNPPPHYLLELRSADRTVAVRIRLLENLLQA